MRHNPERTAWIVLWAAFLTFCLLVYLIPTGIQWVLQNTTTDQAITLATSGTVAVQRPGRASPEVNLTDIPVGSLISTQTNAQASLTFLSPDKRGAVASVQIYGDTQVFVERAESPRFGEWSSRPYRITLNITTGRIRVFSAGEASRDVRIEITSAPDAVTMIESLGANASVDATLVQTTVTVREGQASVAAQGQVLALTSDQRADVVANAPPRGPLPVERNLIRDGDFREKIGVAWQTDIRQPAIPTENPGLISPVTIGGRRAVNFLRLGTNWAQAGLVQNLNQDVRDFKLLKLQLDVYLAYQDVGNCGVQGTECPVMVKLRYEDFNRVEREWLQGFYYRADPPSAGPLAGLTFCAPCSPRYGDHLQYQQNQWQTYESGNLLELFRANEQPAAVIKSISVYGSGHTFDSNVAQIQLLASD